MAKGRAVTIVLDEMQKAALTALTRKHGAPQSLAVRARIVLSAARGLTNQEIAAKHDVCAHTAGLWRNTGEVAIQRFTRTSRQNRVAPIANVLQDQ
jgi:hypothetical protein